MDTRILHIPSGAVYENRKQAKEKMGHGNFDRALRRPHMMFLSTYGPSDIII